jgi:hypothetical protein
MKIRLETLLLLAVVAGLAYWFYYAVSHNQFSTNDPLGGSNRA